MSIQRTLETENHLQPGCVVTRKLRSLCSAASKTSLGGDMVNVQFVGVGVWVGLAIGVGVGVGVGVEGPSSLMIVPTPCPFVMVAP